MANKLTWVLEAVSSGAESALGKLEMAFAKTEKAAAKSGDAIGGHEASNKAFIKGAAGLAASLAGSMGVVASLDAAVDALKRYKQAQKEAGEQQGLLAEAGLGLAAMNPTRVAETQKTAAAVGASYGVMPADMFKLVEPLQGLQQLGGTFESAMKAAIPALELAKLGTAPEVAGQVIKYGVGIGLSPEKMAALTGAAAEKSGFTIPQMAEAMPGMAEWGKDQYSGLSMLVKMTELMTPDEAKTALEKMNIALNSENDMTKQAALKMTGSFEKYSEIEKAGGKGMAEKLEELSGPAMASFKKLEGIEKLKQIGKSLSGVEDVDIAFFVDKMGLNVRQARPVARLLRNMDQLEESKAWLKEQPIDFNAQRIAAIEEDPASAARFQSKVVAATTALNVGYGPQAETYREELKGAEARGAAVDFNPESNVDPTTGQAKPGAIRRLLYEMGRMAGAGGTGGASATYRIPSSEDVISGATSKIQSRALGGKSVAEYKAEIGASGSSEEEGEAWTENVPRKRNNDPYFRFGALNKRRIGASQTTDGSYRGSASYDEYRDKKREEQFAWYEEFNRRQGMTMGDNSRGDRVSAIRERAAAITARRQHAVQVKIEGGGIKRNPDDKDQ